MLERNDNMEMTLEQVKKLLDSLPVGSIVTIEIPEEKENDENN